MIRGWPGWLAVVLDERLERAANGVVVRGGRGWGRRLLGLGLPGRGLPDRGLLGPDLLGFELLGTELLDHDRLGGDLVGLGWRSAGLRGSDRLCSTRLSRIAHVFDRPILVGPAR
jgi:hypothetical protein